MDQTDGLRHGLEEPPWASTIESTTWVRLDGTVIRVDFVGKQQTGSGNDDDGQAFCKNKETGAKHTERNSGICLRRGVVATTGTTASSCADGSEKREGPAVITGLDEQNKTCFAWTGSSSVAVGGPSCC
jgi:hypothetical protein